jgi:hypothetical protein
MKRIVVAVGFIFISAGTAASPWCEPDEAVLLNGQVGAIKQEQFVSRGQLSLCAKPSTPPFEQLSYRYGKNEVELAYSAPKDGLMYLESQQVMPRASVDALYFRRGEFTYAITDCNGMHCGLDAIALMVFKGDKRVALLVGEPDRFERNIDFLDSITGNVVEPRESGLDFDAQ